MCVHMLGFMRSHVYHATLVMLLLLKAKCECEYMQIAFHSWPTATDRSMLHADYLQVCCVYTVIHTYICTYDYRCICCKLHVNFAVPQYSPYIRCTVIPAPC